MSFEDFIMKLQMKSMNRNADKLIIEERNINMAELKDKGKAKANYSANPSKKMYP